MHFVQQCIYGSLVLAIPMRAVMLQPSANAVQDESDANEIEKIDAKSIELEQIQSWAAMEKIFDQFDRETQRSDPTLGLMDGEHKSILGECDGFECVKRYVDYPDNAYSWYDTKERITGVENNVSWMGFVLNMTSQQWMTEATVDWPIWWHLMVVVVPSTVDVTDWATLTLDFGVNTPHAGLLRIDNREPHDYLEDSLQHAIAIDATNLKLRLDILKRSAIKAAYVATKSRTIACSVLGLPNAFETFGSDVTKVRRVYDFLKAYSYRDFIKHGAKQPERISELPMTKAVVRAMDTVTDFAKKVLDRSISRFGIAGYSKLGTITFMVGAVDDRVKAITPAAINLDLIDMFTGETEDAGMIDKIRNILKPPLTQHDAMETYKLEAFAYEYDTMISAAGTPEFFELHKIVDPISYVRFLQGTTKLYIMGTHDNIFNDLMDHAQFLWPMVPGEKNLKFVPNCEHEETLVRSLATVAAFYRGVSMQKPLPEIAYKYTAATRKVNVTLLTPDKPIKAGLYVGFGGRAKDFTHTDWMFEDLDLHGNQASGIIPKPPIQDFEGAFLQIEYEWPEPGYSYTITTPVYTTRG